MILYQKNKKSVFTYLPHNGIAINGKRKKPLSAGVLVHFHSFVAVFEKSKPPFLYISNRAVLFLTMIAADRGNRYGTCTIYTESHNL